MITILVAIIVVLLVVLAILHDLYKAEMRMSEDALTENRRLDMENLQLTTRIGNLNHALDISGEMIESYRQAAHEERQEVMRKAWLKNHPNDIEMITRDIENGMRG